MYRDFEFVNTSEAPVGALFRRPVRATEGSAGYDFCSPVEVDIKPHATVKIRTYIRAKIPAGEVLLLFARSSLAINDRLVLANAVGVIDSDYYGNSLNGGEIICALRNVSAEARHIYAGERIMQGVFMPFLKTETDKEHGVRSGGIGSTGR